MPDLEVNNHGIAAIEAFSKYLQQLLRHANLVKPTKEIEPALSKSDFEGIYGQVEDIFAYLHDDPKNRKYAIVETVARDVFGQLIATTAIDSPDFVGVWNLFDILSIFSDNGQCDPPLLFWLIEELLDSQTIAGCRKVFDYLESRREIITPNNFNSKKLVILRSCNDLLRRLSRAEDTPFCGRVFIFLFQVFPLGDKSSVNLRGECHVENVTTYDDIAPKEGVSEDTMDVDSVPDGAKQKGADGKSVDFDALYPVFWSLQTSFSQPKKLFEPAHFAQFKASIETTMAAFQKLRRGRRSNGPQHLDDLKRGAKRKRELEDEQADAYNPKYLTSRDLFELETSDLTFRRHFLLQALIIMEFLLSLSPQAKEKLATARTPNKSVIFSSEVLSEEDTAWVRKTKHDITEHIKNGDNDGAYFFRMVDTILARDKNWVRWKVESCQSIERPAVTAEEFVRAKSGAQRAFARPRRANNMPVGALSLDFLDGAESAAAALDQLKQPSRYALPELASFERDIAHEDLEIEMPDSERTKMLAEERKASKTWRALRIVRQTKLAAFDRIENDAKIDVVYGDDGPDGADNEGGDGVSDCAAAADVPVHRDSLPQDVRPVVLVGLADAPRAAAAQLLLARNPGVFAIVPQHTTRPLGEDASALLYRPVDAKTFSTMLDGDRFACFGEAGGASYGTQTALVDAVKETGKVPLLLMQYECVESARDNMFDARYVFVRPSSAAALEEKLKADGGEAAEVQAASERAKAILAKADADGKLFDKVLSDDEPASTAKTLEAFVYGMDEDEPKPAAADTVNTEGAEKPGESRASEEEAAEENKASGAAADGQVDEAVPASEARQPEDATMTDADDVAAAANAG